jgi:hypothetical protein
MKVTSFLTKDFSLRLFSQLTFEITTTAAAALPTTACASIGAQVVTTMHWNERYIAFG